MFGYGTLAIVVIILIASSVITIMIAMSFRTVVETNEVHIVQSSSKTVAFGRGEQAGNVYYAWPSWLPVIGIKEIVLPVSVFDIQLKEYCLRQRAAHRLVPLWRRSKTPRLAKL